MGTEGDEPEDGEPSVKFEVIGSDVDAAWDLVQLSFETHKSFKVSILVGKCFLIGYVQMAIRDELEKKTEDVDVGGGLLKDDEIDEEIIWAGVKKIKLIYDRVDENDEVRRPFVKCLDSNSLFLQLLVSVMKRDKLYPTTHPGVDVDVFVKVGSRSFCIFF